MTDYEDAIDDAAGAPRRLEVAPPETRADAATWTALIYVVSLLTIGSFCNMMAFYDRWLDEGMSKWKADSLQIGLVLVPPLVWVIWNGAKHRATFGMRKKNLVFRTADFEPISLRRFCVRVLVGLLCAPAFPVSWLLCNVDKKHRSIADLLCGTVICRAAGR